jgi:predicted methyltransferase MtxX (methanogen marker protein 4)
LVVAANLEGRYRTVGMVDDGGRLMAVCSRDQVVRVDARRMSSLETHVELFHVDLQEETLSRIEDLGERAVFAGLRGAVIEKGYDHNT